MYSNPVPVRLGPEFLIRGRPLSKPPLSLGSTLLGNTTDLLLALLEAAGLNTPIPFCRLIGLINLFIFFYNSLIIAVICFARCLAVLSPCLYKGYLRTCYIIITVVGVLGASLAVSCCFVITGVVAFEYKPPPEQMGCTFRQTRKEVYLLISMLTLCCLDLSLFACYLILYKQFYKPGIRACMNKFKATARRICIIITASYFLLYVPLLFSYAALLIIDTKGVALRIDYVLRLIPHIHSTVVPIILVQSKCLEESKIVSALVLHGDYIVKTINEAFKAPVVEIKNQSSDICELGL